MGKGSNRRPMQIPQSKFAAKWDKAFGKNKSIIKFNGGKGALLCNECNVILAEGTDHETDFAYMCSKCLQTSAKWELKDLTEVYIRAKFDSVAWIPIEQVRYEGGTIVFLSVVWQIYYIDEVVIVKYKPE